MEEKELSKFLQNKGFQEYKVLGACIWVVEVEENWKIMITLDTALNKIKLTEYKHAEEFDSENSLIFKDLKTFFAKFDDFVSNAIYLEHLD